MKARIREVELSDATARDIAAVIAATIAARTPQLQEPTDEDLRRYADEAIAADPIEIIEPATPPAFGVTRADEAMTQLATAAFAEAGIDLDTDGEPELDWRSIPVEFRWWNNSMRTCHIRQRPGVDLAMCKLSAQKIGTKRTAFDQPPAESIADVCGNCRRRLQEAGRA